MNGHRNVVEWMICNGGARVDCVDSDGETIFGLLARLVFALPTLHRVCYDLLITSWFRYGLDEMASFVHNLKQQQQQQPSTLQTTPKEVSWQQRMAEAIIREADVEPRLGVGAKVGAAVVGAGVGAAVVGARDPGLTVTVGGAVGSVVPVGAGVIWNMRVRRMNQIS